MKKNLTLFLCLALLLGACKKNHDDKGGGGNTWTFKGTTYQAGSVTYSSSFGVAELSASATGATSTSVDALVFEFPSAPTSSGQFLITDTGDPNTMRVAVTKLSGGVATGYYSGETTVKADVNVNGKVSVSFPGNIWLYNIANSSDSAQLSTGTITEQ
jgi:hypothetical protein